VSIEPNPDGISPLHAVAIYSNDDWGRQADRDMFAAAAAIGLEWMITAPFRIFHAEQVFPNGRRAPLVFFSEPFGGKSVDTIVDESGRGHALAALIAEVDDETRQLVDWFLGGCKQSSAVGNRDLLLSHTQWSWTDSLRARVT
jgi:hypothetical protein